MVSALGKVDCLSDGPLGEADLEKMDIIQGRCGQTLNNWCKQRAVEMKKEASTLSDT